MIQTPFPADVTQTAPGTRVRVAAFVLWAPASGAASAGAREAWCYEFPSADAARDAAAWREAVGAVCVTGRGEAADGGNAVFTRALQLGVPLPAETVAESSRQEVVAAVDAAIDAGAVVEFEPVCAAGTTVQACCQVSVVNLFTGLIGVVLCLGCCCCVHTNCVAYRQHQKELRQAETVTAAFAAQGNGAGRGTKQLPHKFTAAVSSAARRADEKLGIKRRVGASESKVSLSDSQATVEIERAINSTREQSLQLVDVESDDDDPHDELMRRTITEAEAAERVLGVSEPGVSPGGSAAPLPLVSPSDTITTLEGSTLSVHERRYSESAEPVAATATLAGRASRE